MREVPPFRIRPITPEDLPYIFSTWLDGQRKVGDRAYLTNSIYYEKEKSRISSILGESNVGIICNPDDSAHILGFLVWDFLEDLFILHYAHMKRTYHRLGIMSAAVNIICPKERRRSGFVVTHINDLTAKMRQKHGFKYNPFIMELVRKLNQRSA